MGYPASGPPSSQTPSEKRLPSAQRICAPVTPTLMAATNRKKKLFPVNMCFVSEITDGLGLQ